MELRSLIKRCFCYSSTQPDPISHLRSRWLSLMHMLRAKYLDLTEKPPQKLAMSELLLNLLTILDSDSGISEDLHMLYALSYPGPPVPPPAEQICSKFKLRNRKGVIPLFHPPKVPRKLKLCLLSLLGVCNHAREQLVLQEKAECVH